MSFLKQNFYKIVVITLLLILGISPIYACEMVAIMGLNGRNIVYDKYDSAELLRAQDLLKYFRELGRGTQDTHGFGVTFYLQNNSHTSNGFTGTTLYQRVPNDRRSAHLLRPSYSDLLYDPETSYINVLMQRFDYPNIRIALLHKRRGTSGPLNIPDPHPWVYRLNERSYSFTHNGSLSNTDITYITNFYTNNTHLRDVEIDDLWNVGVDSGLFFAYLVMIIKAHNMDILRGLQNGLTSLGNNTPQHNFILTDGYDLYAYKNYSGTPLSYYWEPLYNIAVVTSRKDQTSQSDYYIRKAFEDENPLRPDRKRNNLNDQELLYLPAHGVPIRFQNFNTSYNLTMVRIADKEINWHGFPLIRQDQSITITGMVNQGYNQGNGNANAIEIVQQYGSAENISNNDWNYVGNFINIPNHLLGMQIEVTNPGAWVSNIGLIKPISDYSGTTMLPGETYWVTYNIASGQSLKEALGVYWDMVYQVKAEKWMLRTIHNQQRSGGYWDPDIEKINYERPMEFGKMYMITLKNDIDPLTSFKWTDSRTPPRSTLPITPYYFTYKEKKDYEVFEILGLSYNEDDVIEIGAFVGNVCIGAVKVEGYPAQLLAYSEGYEGQPITFRALYKNGIISEIDPVVKSVNDRSGELEERIYTAGSTDYAIILLQNKKSLIGEGIGSLVPHHMNYPNPFNPSTMISFSTTNQSPISISVFNSKGQIIKLIFAGTLPAGKYFLEWHGTDQNNRMVASGVYFYRITTNTNIATGKMLLVK